MIKDLLYYLEERDNMSGISEYREMILSEYEELERRLAEYRTRQDKKTNEEVEL